MLRGINRKMHTQKIRNCCHSIEQSEQVKKSATKGKSNKNNITQMNRKFSNPFGLSCTRKHASPIHLVVRERPLCKTQVEVEHRYASN